VCKYSGCVYLDEELTAVGGIDKDTYRSNILDTGRFKWCSRWLVNGAWYQFIIIIIITIITIITITITNSLY